MERFYVGVDVGTTSARAALVDSNGRILKTSTCDIITWQPQSDFYVQSTDNIWQACCYVIREIVSGVDRNTVRGLGFDATCSLVVLNADGRPHKVIPEGENQQNVVMWLDHRAIEEAKLINSINHKLLENYGGTISLEQQPPKILWLKKNMGKEWWQQVGHLFDLPDFLTWRATTSSDRSLCSLTCKWAYSSEPNQHGWDASFYEQIGLKDLVTNGNILGNVVHSPGYPVGHGLSKDAATELGLNEGTAVSTSMIDAHCGAIGMLGCKSSVVIDDTLTHRLALICGTSTCHMALSEKQMFITGVWGPLYSALLPGFWLHEGGQSAAGNLLDHVIESHVESAALRHRLGSERHIQDELNDILENLRVLKGLDSVSYLTKDLHVWPDFHGNRSPIADPTLRGMISGLTLDSSEEDLAILYLGIVQSLAYGTRHIIQKLTKTGHLFTCIVMCGGLSKNPLFVKSHADILELPVIIPNERESVLLGAAMMGAAASGDFPSLTAALHGMGGMGSAIIPDQSLTRYHLRKYAVFLKMLEHQREYKTIMTDSPITD